MHWQPDSDHVASFSEEGRPEQWQNFDYAAVDAHLNPHQEREPEQTEIDERAAEAIRRLLLWCFPRTRNGNLTISFRRFATVATAIDPDLTGVKNYTHLALKLGCTKATISKLVVDLSRGFAVHLGQRSDSARAHMRQARLAQRLPGADKAIYRGRRRSPKPRP
jgi:hypothetical protein